MSEIELKRANVLIPRTKPRLWKPRGLSEQMEQLRIKQKVMPHLKL